MSTARLQKFNHHVQSEYCHCAVLLQETIDQSGLKK
jgi:hypothetical protein